MGFCGVRWKELGLLLGWEEALTLDLLLERNCLSCGWDIGILLVIGNDNLPRPFLAFHPLSTHERGFRKILLVILDRTDHRVQVGCGDRFSDLGFVESLCPLEGVGHDLKSCILETNGLCPLFLRFCGPGIAKILGTSCRRERI